MATWHHGRPAGCAPLRRRYAAAIARTHRRRWQCNLRPGRHRLRLRQHGGLPIADPAAADGGQPAQGVLPAVRQGDTTGERKEILSETGSLLDYVAAEGAALNKRIGAADRALVSDYLDSVREVELRVQRLSTSKSAQMNLPNAPQGVPDDFGDHLDALFDMIALSWQANMTRVSSFMLAKEVSMRTYPNLKITEAFHPLSHHANDPSKIERLIQIQNYHTQVFAKFIKKLSTTQDATARCSTTRSSCTAATCRTATCTTTIRCRTW